MREIPVEAEYTSITFEKVVSEGGQHMVEVPANYGSVDKRTLIKSERYEWRRAVCAPGTLRRSSSSSRSIASAGANSGSGTSSSQTSHSSSSYSSGGSRYSSSSTYTSTATSSGATHKSPTSQRIGTTKTGRTYYYGTNKPVE